MPSGFEVNSEDFDSIFALRHAGWPMAPACGYTIASVDINQRYAPLSTGSQAAATFYRDSAGHDLNTYFAAAGSTGVQVGTQPGNVSGSAAAGNPSGTVTSSAASCSGTKGGGSYTYTWHTSGCTANSPNSSSTTFYATVNAGTTLNATAYCTISDGITSVNTNTISVSLQNTTPQSFDFTIEAGNNSNGGFSGYVYNGYGAISPSGAIGDGNTLQDLYFGHTNGNLSLSVSSSKTLTASYVASLVINGQTWTGTGATFTYGGTTFTWSWAGANVMNGGNNYPGSLTYNG